MTMDEMKAITGLFMETQRAATEAAAHIAAIEMLLLQSGMVGGKELADMVVAVAARLDKHREAMNEKTRLGLAKYGIKLE